jgi:hypothetical protein
VILLEETLIHTKLDVSSLRVPTISECLKVEVYIFITFVICMRRCNIVPLFSNISAKVIFWNYVSSVYLRSCMKQNQVIVIQDHHISSADLR